MTTRSLLTSVSILSLSISATLHNSSRAVDVLSVGMSAPLTISQAPTTFGAIAGDLLLVDGTAQKAWRVSAIGGTPVLFADFSPFGSKVAPAGGMILPTSGWGDQSGKFIVVGGNANNPPPGPNLGPPGDMFTVASDGTVQHYVTLSGLEAGAPFSISPRVPRLVPADFGTGLYAGQLSITDFQGGLHLLRPVVTASGSLEFSSVLLYDHNRPDIAGTDLDINPVGSAFAPGGWGAFGHTVLLSDSLSGQIIALREDGSVTPFANIPLLPGQIGLRNIEFGPPDFLLNQLGIHGELLFVSAGVSASGPPSYLGDVLALDSGGNIVASLRTFLDVTKFNPHAGELQSHFFRTDGAGTA